MELKIELLEPVGGYWDGGLKKSFTWSIYNYNRPAEDNKGFFVKVGSFEANYWFCISAGKTKLQTERQILGNVLRKLKLTLIKNNQRFLCSEFIDN